MILNVINDIRNGRREALEAHLLSRRVPYRLWDAVMLPGDTVASINASHKQIVRWAKSIDAQCVAIAEDDVFFAAPDGWKYWLSKWDQGADIYLGANYSNSRQAYYELVPEELAGHLYTEIIGLHCYIIRSAWYDAFLSVPDNAHIDTAQKGGLFLVPYPFAAIQSPGLSANSKQFVDLNVNLKPEDVYGGLPDWTKEA